MAGNEGEKGKKRKKEREGRDPRLKWSYYFIMHLSF
jgi:hypothetical protein